MQVQQNYCYRKDNIDFISLAFMLLSLIKRNIDEF